MQDVQTAKSLETLTADEVKRIREAAWYDYVRYLGKSGQVLEWGRQLFPEKFTKPFCAELHNYFVDIRTEHFTVVEAPRDHAKTTIKCFLIPIFQALVESEKYDYYVNVQATEKKALAVNTSIKLELEHNQFIKRLYGNQETKDKWTDQLFVLKNGVAFQCVSTGQSLRGTNYRNRRPNYIIIDDLYDDEDINNPDSTQKKNEWFWSTVYPMLAEDRNTCLHVQGTAINKQDILFQLKENGQVRYRNFKTIIDKDKKIVLWPELKSYEERMRQKELMPDVIFEREYQNERFDDTSSIVKRSWLVNWEYDPNNLNLTQHKRVEAVVLSIDPSIGKKSESDPAGFALGWKIQRDDGSLPQWYIENVWNQRLSLQERLDLAKQIVDQHKAYHPVTKIKVEAISGFQDFGDTLSSQVSVPVELIDHVPDKITHLQKKSHYFQNHRVFLNKNIDQQLKDQVVYQLCTNHPDHDDLRDAILHLFEDETEMWNFV